MDSQRSEYSEAEQRRALQRMQSALKAVRRPTRHAAVGPPRAFVADRPVAQRDEPYEAGMFQECGLLA